MPTPSKNPTSANTAKIPIVQHLGIPFWSGTCRALLEQLRENGGLLVVPSGPNLTDCRHDDVYKTALRTADAAVMDSGFLALILRIQGKRRLSRISGLQVLEVLLNHPEGASNAFLANDTTLWVVPNSKESARIQRYLSSKGFPEDQHSFYEAPFYPSSMSQPIDDPMLTRFIQNTSPTWVILCVAGGKQEKLGLNLRNNLGSLPEEQCVKNIDLEADEPERSTEGSDHKHRTPHNITNTLENTNRPRSSKVPAILCTGAAIAFLTGGQAHIPRWADRFYLGWLFRILQNPKKYTYRYIQALRLPFVLQAWKD